MNESAGHEEMVTITATRLQELGAAEKRLAALEVAGVDNWEGYGHAMRILHGDEDDY